VSFGLQPINFENYFLCLSEIAICKETTYENASSNSKGLNRIDRG